MAIWRWHAAILALLAFMFTPLLGLPNQENPRRQAAESPSINVQQLVAGLGFNIMAQQGQIAVASAMQRLLQAPSPAPSLFETAKDDLLSFMSCGMRIRGNNMQLSGVNPQITRGLAQLEETQVLQMALANNLTGDAANDGPILDKLQSEFAAAVQKNQGLQALATGGSSLQPMLTKRAEAAPAATGQA